MTSVYFISLAEHFQCSTCKFPDIHGLEHYKGRIIHSAKWDTEYDFRGKDVAVIGAGASAVQIVPNLQPGR